MRNLNVFHGPELVKHLSVHNFELIFNLVFDTIQLLSHGALPRAQQKSPAELSVGLFVCLLIFIHLVNSALYQEQNIKPRQQWRGFRFLSPCHTPPIDSPHGLRTRTRPHPYTRLR